MTTPTGHPDPALKPWQRRLHTIVFEADTPAGKLFDVCLLVAIVLSIVVVMLETVEPIRARHGKLLVAGEWFFTALFTAEYLLRLSCVRIKRNYALSFFGIVDLLAILPTLVSLVLPRSQTLLVVRSLRLLRVFRVFKMGRFLSEADVLKRALWRSRNKITVFLTAVLIVIVIMGALMYSVEAGKDSDFSSLPQSMYWAVVTMTTVGYGDIAPSTVPGKLIASAIMILGYAFIIIPAGIVSSEIAVQGKVPTTQVCPSCSKEGHDTDARHCKFCGAHL